MLAAQLLPQLQGLVLAEVVLFQGHEDQVNDFQILLGPFTSHLHNQGKFFRAWIFCACDVAPVTRLRGFRFSERHPWLSFCKAT